MVIGKAGEIFGLTLIWGIKIFVNDEETSEDFVIESRDLFHIRCNSGMPGNLVQGS